MPRSGRVVVPNMPHHIVQRGHNRGVVFVEDSDYQYYLDNLIEFKREFGLKLFSYCLMTNHIHLIVQPLDDLSSVGKLMKRLAGRQTRLVNKSERRTGSLWDGRYKTSVIDTDEYLLQCCRYVELNPVKAGMTDNPEDYKWSSYRALVGLDVFGGLDRSEQYTSLGATDEQRRRRYVGFVNAKSEASKQHGFIQNAVARNQLTGGGRFIDEVERRVGVRVENRGQGRPPKS
ncbi:MAG: transposase [Agarilytica sp.]